MRDDEITRMDHLPYRLYSFRLLLPVHKSARNLRLLCQVFSFAKSVSGLLIIVVWVMIFKQMRCPVGFSLTKIQKRHWLTMSVVNCKEADACADVVVPCSAMFAVTESSPS